MESIKWKRRDDDLTITVRLKTERLSLAGYKYAGEEQYPILLVGEKGVIDEQGGSRSTFHVDASVKALSKSGFHMDSFEMEVAGELVHAHADGEDLEALYREEVTIPCESIIYGVSVRSVFFSVTSRSFRVLFHV